MEQKIAFMGVSGAGKDYLAKYLVENHDYIRFSFSDQLKRIASLIYPWLEQDYPPIMKEGPLQKPLSTGETITMSPRQIWLHLNSLRDVEKHIFIRMLEEQIQRSNSSKNDRRILVTDVRSNDEFEWCKKNNFTVVYIETTGNVYKSYEIDAHILKNKNRANLKFINKHNGLSDFEEFYNLEINNS